MYILSLDTTAKTAAAGISEYSDGKLLPVSQTVLNSTLTHSESILPMIDFCLKNARLTLDDIELCAISAGPGSFTGVRIGISTLKGLAFGRKIKCIPVSTLEALCHNVDDAKRDTIICAVMDARRNQFYNALFKADGCGNIKRLCPDRAISAEDLFSELSEKYSSKNILFVGDGAVLAQKLLNLSEINIKASLVRYDRMYQDAYSVAKTAILIYDEKKDYSSEQLSPVYLRLSQAERERNERLSKEK